MVVTLRTVAYAAWLLAIGVVGVIMFNYENAAGKAGVTSSNWPSQTKIPLSDSRPTLVMFAHPKCPCTRASIEELNQLLAGYSSRLSTHVLFFKPSNMNTQWTHTVSWQSVSKIPGVTVAEDRDGEEARRFGAETSGQVVLYDTKGHLLFKGGITAARGHVGDNVGVDRIASALTAPNGQMKQTPVYGCSLLGECATSKEQKIY